MQALRIFEILEFSVFSDSSFAHRVARVSGSRSKGANLIQTQKEENLSYQPCYWRHFFKDNVIGGDGVSDFFKTPDDMVEWNKEAWFQQMNDWAEQNRKYHATATRLRGLQKEAKEVIDALKWEKEKMSHGRKMYLEEKSAAADLRGLLRRSSDWFKANYSYIMDDPEMMQLWAAIDAELAKAVKNE